MRHPALASPLVTTTRLLTLVLTPLLTLLAGCAASTYVPPELARGFRTVPIEDRSLALEGWRTSGWKVMRMDGGSTVGFDRRQEARVTIGRGRTRWDGGCRHDVAAEPSTFVCLFDRSAADRGGPWALVLLGDGGAPLRGHLVGAGRSLEVRGDRPAGWRYHGRHSPVFTVYGERGQALGGVHARWPYHQWIGRHGDEVVSILGLTLSTLGDVRDLEDDGIDEPARPGLSASLRVQLVPGRARPPAGPIPRHRQRFVALVERLRADGQDDEAGTLLAALVDQ